MTSAIASSTRRPLLRFRAVRWLDGIHLDPELERRIYASAASARDDGMHVRGVSVRPMPRGVRVGLSIQASCRDAALGAIDKILEDIRQLSP